MQPLIEELNTGHTPEFLAARLRGEPGVVLLRSALFDSVQARYSFVAARPFLTLRALGSRCELISGGRRDVQFGNPWHVLDALMARYELLDEVDLPFPLGGCFGYWGYDLKNFVEPKLPCRAVNDLELPDCQVGFYDSLVAFDHQLGKVCVIATGLGVDGSRNELNARRQREFWKAQLGSEAMQPAVASGDSGAGGQLSSTMSRDEFVARVERAQRYIRAGDVYQVNLAQRLAASNAPPGWDLYQRLAAVSPAPFSAYLDCGRFRSRLPPRNFSCE